MHNSLNNNLINAIKEKLPANKLLADALMEYLSIGREAAYRRIRGEVPFAFFEVTNIALKLGISMDKIAGMGSSDHAVFDVKIYPSDSFDIYCEELGSYIGLFEKISQTKTQAKILLATNTLPYLMYLNYNLLGKFHLYKYIYQTQNDPNFSFSKLIIPQKVVDLHTYYHSKVHAIKNSQIILDKNLFIPTINEIRFLEKRGLLSKEEISELTDELLEVANNLEAAALTGIDTNGIGMDIYLSNINIDGVYFFMNVEDLKLSYFRIYGANNLKTYNDYVCEFHEGWIESYKKYSTLITKSNEIERIDFFKKQREHIQELRQIS